MAGICSCGSRKVETTKHTTELDAKATLQDNSAETKQAESNNAVTLNQVQGEKETGFEFTDETDFTANDAEKPILLVTGIDTLKIYNANVNHKRTKKAFSKQKDTETIANTSVTEKVQQTRQNDIKQQQEIKAAELDKGKTVERVSWGWYWWVLLIVAFIIIWLVRRKNRSS